jgi:hypothetical protein
MKLNSCAALFVIFAVAGCAAEESSVPVPSPSIGITVPTPPSVPSAPPPLDPLLFHSEPAGAEPTNFVVLAGYWTVRSEGNARVLRVDGTQWKIGTPPAELSNKARLLFPDSAAAFEKRVLGGLQFPYGVTRQIDTFSSGELSVDFKLVDGESDQFAALLFGLTQDANHYAYRYNTKDGDTALWRVANGQRERLHHGGVPVKVALGEWRTLRLRIAGAHLTGFVNDTQALTFTLPAPVSGKIGLWSKADSVTDYKNFHVQPAK